MNIASIDIGSNTVLLLIASVDTSSQVFQTILNKYEAPRLGRGLKDDGNISNESINKLLNVIKSYSELFQENKCEEVICTATNAMRVANNSDKIIEKVFEQFGIKINIITGDREAELSFLGAATVLPNAAKKIVMDIGGGSTEVIYGSDEEIIYKKSFPIGAVNLTERFVQNEIPREDEVKDLEEFIQETFEELKNIIPSGTPLIAVAGTPTSLSAINLGLKKYDDTIVEGSQLSISSINEFISHFKLLTPTQIIDNFGKMLSGREDVILAGSLILKNVALITGNNKVTVSGRGIRYGSIIDYLHKLPR